MPRTRAQRARTEQPISFPRTTRAQTVPDRPVVQPILFPTISRRPRQGREAVGRFVRSNKGKKLLVCDGYTYNINSKAKGTAYWRCVKGGKNGVCNGTARTTLSALTEEGDQVAVTLLQDHLHHRDETEIAVQEIVRNLHVRAVSQPNDAPSSLIRDAIAEVREEAVLHRLPARQTLARNVRRIQARTRPANPRSLRDLTVFHPYDKTIGGAQFLQHDITYGEDDRLLMFYTLAALTLLCNSRVIFCDGTFKVAPKLFYQLYTIHVVVGAYVYPVIYCLSTRKNQQTYELIFNRLKEHAASLGLNFAPTRVTCDFEMAAMNAIRTVLPDAEIAGCQFHFGQSVWRQAQRLGLQSLYDTEPAIKESVNYLLALPFVPIEDLNTVFEYLYNEIEDEMLPLWQYLDQTYVRRRPARGRRQGSPALFPPPLWNVVEACRNHFARSNNFVEGWHSKFAKLLVTPHANIWKFFEYLRK